jgi:hypothetical protein
MEQFAGILAGDFTGKEVPVVAPVPNPVTCELCASSRDASRPAAIVVDNVIETRG